MLFVSDVHNHPGAANFEATARNYWPEKPPRILNYTLAAWADQIRIPVAQISPALAASLVAGSGKSLEDLAKAAETARGTTALALPGARVDLRTAVDRHVVPDRNVVALLEGSDRAAEERVGDRLRALRSQRRRRARRSSTAPTTTDRARWRSSRSPRHTRSRRQAGQRPKRSVLFAAWNSEERGLLGAWAYRSSRSRR